MHRSSPCRQRPGHSGRPGQYWKSRVSTTKTQANRPTIANTWLRTTAPTPTPAAAQSADIAIAAEHEAADVAGVDQQVEAARADHCHAAAECEARAERAEADTEDDACEHLAATTSVRAGVKTNVARIVPCRNSLVIAMTPIRAAKAAAKEPFPISSRWFSSEREIGLAAEAAGDHAEQDQRNRPSSSPRFVRVVAILRSSERSWAVTARSRRSARGRPSRAWAPPRPARGPRSPPAPRAHRPGAGDAPSTN